MNKNDFYKELLSQYTFDSEKIKMNAKRPKRSFYRNPAVYISTAAAAAAITVTIGVFTFMSATTQQDISVKPETYELSAAQRLEEAEQNYRIASYSANNDSEIETVDMYVSFNSPMTYNEALILFSGISDTGDICFAILYTDEGKITDNFDGYNGKINGLKITAPSNYYKAIQDLSSVSVVELGSENVNDDNFTPINDQIKSEITGTEEITPQTTASEETTPPPAENVTIGDSANIGENDTTMTVPTVTTLEYKVNGINDAIFVSENCFVAITNTSVELNRIEDGEEGKYIVSVAKVLTDNPKIIWSDDSNSLLFISGCDSEKNRNKLFIADSKAETLEELDISGMTDDAELGGLFYDKESGEITIKTYSLSKSCVYTGMMSDDGLCVELSVESEHPVTPLAYMDSVLYYAYAKSGVTYVHSIDTETNEDEEIWSHEGSAKFARSDSFNTAALIFDSESFIFSAETEAFAKAETTGSIQFSKVNSTVFSDDNGYYTLTAAGVVSISSEAADIYFAEPTNSVEYSVYEILPDIVRIKIR